MTDPEVQALAELPEVKLAALLDEVMALPLFMGERASWLLARGVRVAPSPTECHAGCDMCRTLNEMDADDPTIDGSGAESDRLQAAFASGDAPREGLRDHLFAAVDDVRDKLAAKGQPANPGWARMVKDNIETVLASESHPTKEPIE